MPIVAGQGLDYNVDIVRCIDATGSMSPIIEEVKTNALSFYKKFVAEMDEANKRVEQLRIKVIVFRDYECDTEPMTQSEFFVLPDENDAFESFVRGITASGGGDGPENGLEAIALALKSDWVTTGSKRRHVILMFSDAPALELGQRSGSPKYPSGMPANLQELGDWWEGTAQIGTFEASKCGRLVVFAPDAYPWSDMQTWNNYWHTPSSGGTGLEDVDIDAAIRLLVCSVGGTVQ